MTLGLGEYTFQLDDDGVTLNEDTALPFVDITKVAGLDSAPYRETTRDHEGTDGGFLDAEFEKGRDISLEGTIYADSDTIESYLDDLKANFAPVTSPIPFYLKAPGVDERLVFVKPRGINYDWATARRIGMTTAQFLMYAEDPRIYASALTSSTITYGGSAGLGLAFTTFLDTYTRTTVGGLGTSDSSHTYTLTGTAADFATNGSTARITLTAATGSVYVATIDTLTAVNQTMFIQGLTLSATPTGATIIGTLDVREVDTNNMYKVNIIWTTSNTVQVSLTKVVAGVTTTLVAAATVGVLTSSSLVSVRAEIHEGDSSATGSILRAKVWATGAAEPSTSTAEAAIDTGVTATGGFRVTAVRSTSNTNTNPIMSWDSLQWWQGIGFSVDFGGGATPSGTVATNAGNRPTPVEFVITGPIENPIITNSTNGHTLSFTITLAASETLVVNTRDRTVLLNGSSNRRNTLTNPDWFFLDPGVNQIFFGGQNGTSATLGISFRSAWR